MDAANNLLFLYKYDPDNRLTNRWSAAKGSTVYGYDAVGNLTRVTYPVSPAITLKYDVLNRLTNMVDAVGTTVYAYENAGQLLSEGGLWPADTVNFTLPEPFANGLERAIAQWPGLDAELRLRSGAAADGHHLAGGHLWLPLRSTWNCSGWMN